MVAIMLYTTKLSFILIKATRGSLWTVCEVVEFVDKEQPEAGYFLFLRSTLIIA